MIIDNEDDAPLKKKSKRRLWYRLTGLPICRQQAEEEAKKYIHHPTTTDFNLNGPENSPKLVMI